MGTILSLVSSLFFFIISYKFKFAYFLFIFLIPFMPEYLGFGIGSEGFSLSLKRIFLIILFMSSALLFTQKSNHMLKQVSQVYQQNRLLINALLLFFVIKIISLSLNSRELSQYMMLFNDFLLSIFIFLLTTIKENH